MSTREKWTADPITDADGNITIRPDDGSENGDTGAQPIATVYDAASALLIEAAPELLEACVGWGELAEMVEGGEIVFEKDVAPVVWSLIQSGRDAIAKTRGQS